MVPPPMALLVGLLAITILSLLVLAWRPSITRAPGGKMLAFAALFLSPGLAVFAGGFDHLEQSKRTDFCLSCHVMEPYGKSLHVDDNEFIPAVHYQNNYVPRDEACYTCHTDYVMYGTLRSKMRGLRHMKVQFFGTIPDTIHLYTPYNNRECLHCHVGARSFEEGVVHTADPAVMAEIKSNKLSCVSSGCHETVHDVARSPTTFG